MIDSTELYILIVAYVTFVLIQGDRDARKQSLCQLSPEVFHGFGVNLV